MNLMLSPGAWLPMFCVLTALVHGQTTNVHGSPPSLEEALSGCSINRTERVVAVLGWGFHLDCDNLRALVGEASDPSTQCVVSSPDLPPQSSSKLLRIDSDGSVTSFNVSFIFDGSRCLRKLVEVHVRPISQDNVQTRIETAIKSDTDVIHDSAVYDDDLIISCLPSGFDRLALPSDYNTTWWRTRVLSNGTFDHGADGFVNYTHFIENSYRAGLISYPDKPPAIELSQIKFWEPATYTCQLQFGNETAFIVHYSLCVKNKLDHSSGPSMLCSQTIHFYENEKVELLCNVQTSNIKIQPGQMEVVWSKTTAENVVCKNEYTGNGSEETQKISDEYSCSIDEFQNIPQKCFSYVPSDSELAQKYPQRKTFKVALNVKSILEEEAGTFMVQMTYAGKTGETQNIEVKFNPQRKLVMIFLILVGILVFLIGIALAVAVVWWRWIQIKLLVRRHFGKYDEDGKEFVAILSYVYSLDLDENTKNNTKTIVKCIQEKMEEMNYRFYDSHRDFDQGSSVENLLKYLNESHRMIVILTDAYVDERWSRFEAQQGFINMMKNRTKLIFVRTPGAKKALTKKKGDDFSMELNEAMKASRNIRWNEKMSESSLKDHIQYALPNLKRSPPQSESTGKDYKKLDNYNRSFSQQTQISMLSGTESNENSKFCGIGDAVV